MLTVLMTIHGIGVGASFCFVYLMEALGGSFGTAFGLPSKKTPVWKIALGSLVWELVLVHEGIKSLNTAK